MRERLRAGVGVGALEHRADVAEGVDAAEHADDRGVGDEGVDARLPAAVAELERGELLGLEGSEGGEELEAQEF